MTDLDQQVAEREGWREVDDVVLYANAHYPGWINPVDYRSPMPKPPPYTTDPAWWGPLIEKYRVHLMVPDNDGDAWGAWTLHGNTMWKGDTLGEAVCRAVLEIPND